MQSLLARLHQNRYEPRCGNMALHHLIEKLYYHHSNAVALEYGAVNMGSIRLLLRHLRVSKRDSQRMLAGNFGMFPNTDQVVSCHYYSSHVSNISLNFEASFVYCLM